MITKAIPVWTDEVTENQYIEAKQCFNVKSPQKAVIQICSDADYALYINGKFVGSGQWRTFMPKKAYDEYDISEYLKNGENDIGVTAYHQGKNSSTYSSAVPFVVFAIDIDGMTVLSGDDTLVRKHPYYVSGAMEMITPQLGYSFCYNSSAKPDEWKRGTVVQSDGVRFFHRPVKKLFRCDEVNGTIKSQGALMRCGDGTPAEVMQSDFLSFRQRNEIFDGTRVKSVTAVYILWLIWAKILQVILRCVWTPPKVLYLI